MPRSVQHLFAARKDLLQIHRYLTNEGAGAAADKLLRRIMRLLEKIAELPDMGVARPELRRGLRSFSVGTHIIFYDYTDKAVRLVRVLHAAQDITPDLFVE